MKKKLTILLVLAIIVLVVAAAILLNRPYKPISFVTDGEIFSATVENGSTRTDSHFTLFLHYCGYKVYNAGLY